LKIRVQYQDDTYDIVEDFALDQLVSSDKIKRFLRYSEGWVTIGLDPIRRSKGKNNYRGPQRRRACKRLQ
jgi:hypothetical protein